MTLPDVLFLMGSVGLGCVIFAAIGALASPFGDDEE